MTTVTARLSQP